MESFRGVFTPVSTMKLQYPKYLNSYTRSRIKSAVLQKYPKKDNEPEILI